MGRTPNACLYRRTAGQLLPRSSYFGILKCRPQRNFPVEISINMTYSSSVARYNGKDCFAEMTGMKEKQDRLEYWRIRWQERKRWDR